MQSNYHLRNIYITTTAALNWAVSGIPQLLVSLFITALVSTITLTLYWLFFIPFIRVKDLHEIGFEYLKGESKRRKVEHKDLVNQIRSLKKLSSVPPIYPNGWFAILRSGEVKKEEVKPVSAIGQHFAVFRTKTGDAHVLDAYCPHLGADLAIGGRVMGNCLECPFHGWQFDGKNGNCVHVPYSDKVPRFAKVKKWNSIEQSGWIFVWYHADNEEPSWTPPEVQQIKSREWVYHGTTEYLVNGHIQEIAENACDIAHFSQVHGPVMMAGSELQELRRSMWNFTGHIYNSTYWNEGAAPDAHTAVSGGIHTMQLFGGKLTFFKTSFKHTQLGPGLVHLSLDLGWGKGVFIQTVLPIAPLKVRLISDFYASRHMPTPFCKLIVYTEAVTVERDVAIWNSKTYLTKPALMKEENYIARHRRWYSQFYSENSPKLTFTKESSTDW